MSLESLVARFGYAAVFAGVFLEGETVLVLGGFAAHRGYLGLPGVIAAAFLATLVADQSLFHLGRIQGAAFLARRPAWERRVARARSLLQTHATLIALGFRFVYGIRTATPFALGMSGMPPLRFALLNCVSAGAWSAALACGGYFLGTSLEYALGDLRRHEAWLAAALVLAGLAGWALRRRRRR